MRFKRAALAFALCGVVGGFVVAPHVHAANSCVPAGKVLLTGEIQGYGPANFIGNHALSPTCVPLDGSTWVRNPYYTSGTNERHQFATAGFRFTNPAGHPCSGFTYTTKRLDGTTIGPYQIIPRAGGTFLLAGSSAFGNGAGYCAGTASCKIDCSDSASSCCGCTCDSMSYTLL